MFFFVFLILPIFKPPESLDSGVAAELLKRCTGPKPYENHANVKETPKLPESLQEVSVGGFFDSFPGSQLSPRLPCHSKENLKFH